MKNCSCRDDFSVWEKSEIEYCLLFGETSFTLNRLLDCTALTNILFVSCLPRFSVTNAPSKREDIWDHQRYYGDCTLVYVTPRKWGFRRKRLRPRLQTFARSVANVCGKGCKRLRLRRAKWAHKSINPNRSLET